MWNGKYILSFDPSGNWEEGKGTTGWVLYCPGNQKVVKFGIICAKHYESQAEYWDAHVQLIDGMSGYNLELVVEDYLLYSQCAQSQIQSRLETPQLIGVLKYEAFLRGLDVHVQTAAMVKKRWSNEILLRKGQLHREEGDLTLLCNKHVISDHTIDALRHAVHYATFGGKSNEDRIVRQNRSRM